MGFALGAILTAGPDMPAGFFFFLAKQNKRQIKTAAGHAQPWWFVASRAKINLGGRVDGDDDDMVDQDDLLAEEDRPPMMLPPVQPWWMTAVDENQPKQVPSSSCGNCVKGDAF